MGVQSHFIAEGCAVQDVEGFSFFRVSPDSICRPIPAHISVYFRLLVWWAAALSRSKDDQFVPQTEYVNLRVVGQAGRGGA